MSNIAIHVENVSKLYRLGDIGTGTLSNDLTRWWSKVRGKEDPFAKIAVTNHRDQKTDSDYVWSLKDINFEVEKGDAIGIIGRNGAGKSTLLKIISRVTAPTTGQIKVKGRIASLLEVGTGFHPELTGRENLYLNGAILGMSKKEITAKFDEIVEFAGVARYIDTPVKRYSSGMYVRLAFGVAAHLNSEILIVDEVLAVGDAEFQKKAVEKIKQVTGDYNKTVLFVSHNMSTIKSLCKKGLLLKNGEVGLYDSINPVISSYLGFQEESTFYSKSGDGRASIKSITYNQDRQKVFLGISEKLEFKIQIQNNTTASLPDTELFFIIHDSFGVEIVSYFSKDELISYDIEGVKIISGQIELNLKPDTYYFSFGFFDEKRSFLDWVQDTVPIVVEEVFYKTHTPFDDRLGISYLNSKSVNLYDR